MGNSFLTALRVDRNGYRLKGWVNDSDEPLRIKPPFNPFYWTECDTGSPPVSLRRLSDFAVNSNPSPVPLYKQEAENVYDLKRYAFEGFGVPALEYVDFVERLEMSVRRAIF